MIGNSILSGRIVGSGSTKRGIHRVFHAVTIPMADDSWFEDGVLSARAKSSAVAAFVAPDSHEQLFVKGLVTVWNPQLICAIVRAFVPVPSSCFDENNSAHSVPAS